jgi:hypothetical protein
MNPIRDENYYPILHKDLCRDCYKKLRITVEDIMEEARPHSSLAGNKKELVVHLNRMTR